MTTPLQAKIVLDIGLPQTRQTYRPDEVAAAFGMSIGAVRNLVDEGILIACEKSVGQRRHMVLERWSVEAWRLNQWEDQGVNVSRFEQSEMVRYWRAELRRIVKLQRGGCNEQ